MKFSAAVLFALLVAHSAQAFSPMHNGNVKGVVVRSRRRQQQQSPVVMVLSASASSAEEKVAALRAAAAKAREDADRLSRVRAYLASQQAKMDRLLSTAPSRL
jgi:DNA-binding response OmpR family regulator